MKTHITDARKVGPSFGTAEPVTDEDLPVAALDGWLSKERVWSICDLDASSSDTATAPPLCRKSVDRIKSFDKSFEKKTA